MYNLELKRNLLHVIPHSVILPFSEHNDYGTSRIDDFNRYNAEDLRSLFRIWETK